MILNGLQLNQSNSENTSYTVIYLSMSCFSFGNFQVSQFALQLGFSDIMDEFLHKIVVMLSGCSNVIRSTFPFEFRRLGLNRRFFGTFSYDLMHHRARKKYTLTVYYH